MRSTTVVDRANQPLRGTAVEGFTNVVTSAEQFTNLHTRIPRGATIQYTADYGEFFVPLGTNKVKLKAFGQLCRENGVLFGAMVPDL